MKYARHLALVAALLVPALPTAAEPPAPDPRTQEIIEVLSLRASDAPLKEHPDWEPKRIVVSMPPWMSQRMPELEPTLRSYAGDTELVIDKSGNRSPEPDLLAGADAYIGFCSLPMMANASEELLWVHNYTAGMDRCAGLEAEQIDGRLFTNSKRLASPAIAEHTMAMLLALSTGLPGYHKAQLDNRWDRSGAAGPRFGELRGKTLLVVGLGGIGTEVARRADGLGMTVKATRNSSREGPDFVEYVGLSDELPALAREADVVVNALPLTPGTTGIFDKAFFDNVKDGAIFLSVGRGASTVNAALLEALESGKLFAAGLDVTDPEPLPEDSPFWDMPNMIITPHVSATSPGAAERTALIAAENLRRYVQGEPLLNVVNMQAGY